MSDTHKKEEKTFLESMWTGALILLGAVLIFIFVVMVLAALLGVVDGSLQSFGNALSNFPSTIRQIGVNISRTMMELARQGVTIWIWAAIVVLLILGFKWLGVAGKKKEAHGDAGHH